LFQISSERINLEHSQAKDINSKLELISRNEQITIQEASDLAIAQEKALEYEFEVSSPQIDTSHENTNIRVRIGETALLHDTNGMVTPTPLVRQAFESIDNDLLGHGHDYLYENVDSVSVLEWIVGYSEKTDLSQILTASGLQEKYEQANHSIIETISELSPYQLVLFTANLVDGYPGSIFNLNTGDSSAVEHDAGNILATFNRGVGMCGQFTVGVDVIFKALKEIQKDKETFENIKFIPLHNYHGAETLDISSTVHHAYGMFAIAKGDLLEFIPFDAAFGKRYKKDGIELDIYTTRQLDILLHLGEHNLAPSYETGKTDLFNIYKESIKQNPHELFRVLNFLKLAQVSNTSLENIREVIDLVDTKVLNPLELYTFQLTLLSLPQLATDFPHISDFASETYRSAKLNLQDSVEFNSNIGSIKADKYIEDCYMALSGILGQTTETLLGRNKFEDTLAIMRCNLLLLPGNPFNLAIYGDREKLLKGLAENIFVELQELFEDFETLKVTEGPTFNTVARTVYYNTPIADVPTNRQTFISGLKPYFGVIDDFIENISAFSWGNIVLSQNQSHKQVLELVKEKQ
jgi:hypothetical protein